VKEEGWWLVVSDEVEAELLALKRLSFTSTITARLTFPAVAAGTSGGGGCVVLHLVSDSYLGLDQRHTVRWGNSSGRGQQQQQQQQ